jgi:hypothetical protein
MCSGIDNRQRPGRGRRRHALLRRANGMLPRPARGTEAAVGVDMQNRPGSSAYATSGSSIRCDPALDGAEESLVREMFAGSERAWREFHARYDRLISRCIARVIARFSAVASQDEAREIRASLFMQLLSNDMHKLRSFDAARGSLSRSRVASRRCCRTAASRRDLGRGSTGDRRVPAASTPATAGAPSPQPAPPFAARLHRGAPDPAARSPRRYRAPRGTAPPRAPPSAGRTSPVAR